MKIFVKAKAGAKNAGMEKTGEANFTVKVKELPMGGKANKAIIKILADYFGIPVSRINLISGHKSKNKIFEVTC